MLRIAVCDDEEYTHNEVEKLMASYEKKRGVKVCLTHYQSAKELLQARDELDVLLLDIEMAQMDGIEAGYILQKREINYKVVMLSAREDRYREAFRIGAFRFVPKPIEEGELYQAIDDVRALFWGLDQVTVFRNNAAYRIAQRDIIFVEADRSSTILYTQKCEYRSEESLAAWEALLDQRMFFHCHRSYLVNLGKIEEIGKDTLVMETGDKVSVSRRSRAALLEAYMVYDTNRR